MLPPRDQNHPIVYSCSGCSSSAQMTNWLALQLDRSGLAQMSCIAGIGGDVRPIVRLAQSGRPIIVLDGCPLSCAKSCLDRIGVKPKHHLKLNELGIRKNQGEAFDQVEAEATLATLVALIDRDPDASGPSHAPPAALAELDNATRINRNI